MTIQWFPGHMAKAKREVEEKLKFVDLVIELLDARAPHSSQNPMLQEAIRNKPRLFILMKRDLADDKATERWINYFTINNIHAISIDANNRSDIQKVIQKVKEISKGEMEKRKRKGIQTRVIRAMIIGIPNVGKSTLINRLASKKIAKIGDRSGITRQQTWIKVNKDFELLDTPGILWPKFSDEKVGIRLAALGTIKDQLLSLQDIAAFVIDHLRNHYPSQLHDRYKVEKHVDDMNLIFTAIGKARGALESGGLVNTDKVAEIILRDLRTGKLGKVSLEFAPQ